MGPRECDLWTGPEWGSALLCRRAVMTLCSSAYRSERSHIWAEGKSRPNFSPGPPLRQTRPMKSRSRTPVEARGWLSRGRRVSQDLVVQISSTNRRNRQASRTGRCKRFAEKERNANRMARRGGRGIVSQLNYSHSKGPRLFFFVGASRVSPCFSRGYKWLRSTFHGVTELRGIAAADMNPLIAVSMFLPFFSFTGGRYGREKGNANEGDEREKESGQRNVVHRRIVRVWADRQRGYRESGQLEEASADVFLQRCSLTSPCCYCLRSPVTLYTTQR